MALGADPMRLFTATVRQGALLAGSGLALGGVLSIWVVRALGGLVFGANGFDVVSIVAASAVLLAAGAAAVVPPARRAARTDPLIALRAE